MEERPFRILIAGGGVAALEATLAVRRLLGESVRPTVLAPEAEFTSRQLLLAEPFSAGSATSLPLAELVAEAGGHHLSGRLMAVRPDERLAVTERAELHYDALLIALGARPIRALPGAITYVPGPGERELESLIDEASASEVRSIAFAVPPSTEWSLPVYELALLMARRLGRPGRDDVRLTVVTHEPEPLAVAGRDASCDVRALLARAGVALRTSSAPAVVANGHLRMVDGETIEADRVVALPRHVVPRIPGVPQTRFGFIPTDGMMQVDGLFRVWAAGDATAFPIKQGGIAAQQADVAAAAIARCVDPGIEPAPFRPVLRAALITGGAPHYLRLDLADEGSSSAAAAPLWWPPAKVAGRLLAPFLVSRLAGSAGTGELEDLAAAGGDDAGADEHNRRALGVALSAADSHASRGEYSRAIQSLTVAEELRLSVPPEYARKRRAWSAALTA